MLSNMNPMVFDVLDIFRRSWWTIVAGVCVGLAAGAIALHYMPKKYEASTTIWISKSQLPESVLRSTVSEDNLRRLLFFKSAVLEQPYMVELIERVYGLPDSEEKLRQLILGVRKRVTVVAKRSARRGLTAFALTTRDKDPRRAAKLVDTLAELYIAQNEEFRSGRAERTAKKIDSMAVEAQAKFDELDQELNRFKTAHRFETADSLKGNQDRLENSEQELETVRSQKSVAQTRLDSLKKALEQGYVPPAEELGGDGVVDPMSRRIAALQIELAALRVQYKEGHPTLKAKKRKLDDLLRQARELETDPLENPLDPEFLDPQLAPVVAEIKVVEAEIAALDVKETRIRGDIAESKRRIRVLPEVQIELNTLQTRHSLARDVLLGLRRDAEKAKESVDLEESDMGERMEILEYAVVPEVPYSPQPIMVHALYLALGCLVFLGPLLLRNLLRPVITSEAGFLSLTDLPMLVSLPLIETGEVRRAGRWRMLKNVGLSMISGAVLVGSQVFVNYM